MSLCFAHDSMHTQYTIRFGVIICEHVKWFINVSMCIIDNRRRIIMLCSCIITFSVAIDCTIQYGFVDEMFVILCFYIEMFYPPDTCM